ncbi:MAG: AsmA family protein [Pseudomonadota bacterium]
MARVKHVVRWGGILIAIALVLLGIGAGVVYYLISRLDIRAEISSAVEQATGRKLTIAGPVGVSFFPVIGLEAHDASLANAAGGRAAALVRMDALHVGVEIAPLFHRQVVVRELAFDHPQIALEIGPDGAPNWRMQPQRPASTAPAPAPSSSTSAMTPQDFSLRQIRITNGEVTFYDLRRNAGWTLNSADLRAALISMDKPFDVSGQVVYLGQAVTMRLEVASPRLAMTGRSAPMTLKIDSALLNAEFNGTTIAATGEFAGRITASGPNLRGLSAWAGAPLVGGTGFGSFAVDGALAVHNSEYSFSNATFTLDQAHGRGDFVLMRRHDKPYISGRLEVFDLDFNPYLLGVVSAPPAAAEGATTSTASVTAAAIAAPRAIDIAEAPKATPLNFSGLQVINADLELTTHKLVFQHLQIDGAMIGLVVNDGFLAATLHQLTLYGGAGSGRLQIDARTPDVKIEQQMTLQGVDANRFLTDAVNFQNIEGKAEITYDMRAHGASQSELVANANGRAHVEIVSGALRGVDMGGLARTLHNALHNELIAPNARTPFQGMSASFALAGGVLASNNVSFNTPDLSVPGLAVIDMNQHRLDARMAPRSPRGGIVFPFSARGPFDHVRYDSDISNRARREIDARVRQVQAASR